MNSIKPEKTGCLLFHRFKQLFYDRVSELGAAVFIHDAFVVHGARPDGKPFAADPAVRELPDIYSAAAFKIQNRRQLFLQRFGRSAGDPPPVT